MEEEGLEEEGEGLDAAVDSTAEAIGAVMIQAEGTTAEAIAAGLVDTHHTRS